MRLKILISELCLLIPLLSFSQGISPEQTLLYPHLEVRNGDSTVVILLEQARLINSTYNALEEAVVLKDSLYSIVKQYEELKDSMQARINILIAIYLNQDEIIERQHELIMLDEKLIRDDQRKKTLLKWERDVLFIAGFLGGFYIGTR